MFVRDILLIQNPKFSAFLWTENDEIYVSVQTEAKTIGYEK